MSYQVLLAVARTFSGAQLAAVAAATGDTLEVRGACLRGEAGNLNGREFTVLTFDCLVRLNLELRPAVLHLAVTGDGYYLL